MLKIYTVTFNDGGWHTSLPKFTTVAISPAEAEEQVRAENKYYQGWDCWAEELKIDGYEITVKNAKAQEREDKIEEILKD